MIVYDASQAGLVELQSARNAIHHRTLRATAEAVRQPGGLTVSQPNAQRTSQEGDGSVANRSAGAVGFG
jgi:hypothetical protein